MGNKESTENIKPKDLKDLLKSTKFSEKELKGWYRDFLKVSLSVVNQTKNLSSQENCKSITMQLAIG